MTALRRPPIVLAVITLLVGAAACDTKVTNPGRFEDTFLNERGAAIAMVNGAARALSAGLNYLSYTGAAVTREIHPAGSTGSFGISARWQNGDLGADDADLNDHWAESQRARFIAEEAIRRIEAAKAPAANDPVMTPATYYNTLQLAYVYAGYANRVLGDNMCAGTIDGGPEVANTVFLTRAESLFTKALAVTGGTASVQANQRTAAYAGRAQVRLLLGKLTEAVADAALVPIGYAFNINYFNLGDDDQRNRIFWATGNSRESGSPYRAHTQWSTWHYDYRQATNDPRVPITTTTLLGDAAIECCGKVPFYPEAKFFSSASPMRLASGHEMRLLEAESKLRNGDITGAMTSIAAVRTDAGAVALAAPATLSEAWRLLKRERGIELWLEARRMSDMRRWKADNTPGALDPLEQPGMLSHLAKQDLCFPISRRERETNPNLKI